MFSSSPSTTRNFKGKYIFGFKFYYTYLFVCLLMEASTCHDPWVEVRGQLAEVVLLFQHVSWGTELKLSGLTDIFTHRDIFWACKYTVSPEIWNYCPTDKLQLLSETFISPAITECRKECGNIDRSKHLHCPPLFSPLSLLSWPIESSQYLIPFEIQTWQFPVLNLTTSKKREFNLDPGSSKAVFAVLWPSCYWWKC